jgi:two-component system chemotaxis sensor kinase CheA
MPVNPYQDLIAEFLLDVGERVSRVEEALLSLGSAADAERPAIVDRVKRDLHTLKGNAGMMGFDELQRLAHEMEDELAGSSADDVDVAGLLHTLDRYRNEMRTVTGDSDATDNASMGGSEADLATGSVRVPFAALDGLMDLIAEMVIFRNRLTEAVDRGRALDTAAVNFAQQNADAWVEAQLAYEALGITMDFIRDRVMRLRMVPLKSLFGSLERLVFDEAQKAAKKVRLETDGGDTPLDKALLETANEALGHLVRNAVIHGLETPKERVASGKPPQGTVSVVAAAGADEVEIDVSDDGGGIDVDRLVKAAEARGIDVSGLDDPYSILLLPGFSTQETTDLSAGRGVGLSAVADAVRRQGGDIRIRSQVGKGTSFHMRLPLSVSITRALLVAADSEEYALPLATIVESRRLHPGDVHRVNGAVVFDWGDEVIPLLDLGSCFGTARAARDKGYVIIIDAAGKKRGLLADEITGMQEIVVKGLDPMVGTPAGVSGSTILGDGRPILILDPRGLVEIEPFVEVAA